MEDRFEFINDWQEWHSETHFAQFQRIQALGVRLWGGSEIENLKRQLELPSPEIPPGTRIEELHALEKYTRKMLASVNDKRTAPKYLTNIVTVGASEFTVVEAMYEIVRRAIAALGN